MEICSNNNISLHLYKLNLRSTLFCIPCYRNLSRIAPLTVHWHERERGARNVVSSNGAIKPI